MNKKEMSSYLLRASDAYYNESNPIMSDEEFDKLLDTFKSLYPNDPLLKTIGAPVDRSSGWTKATHKIPMGSLSKVTNDDEFNKWSKKSIAAYYCLSEKLDGISIDLEYENGVIVKAITRGDGEIGENITKNVIQMQNVKLTIDDFTGSIRGEIVLKQADFDAITYIQNERLEIPITNMRNGASGLAKRQDGKYSEYLSIIYYDITGYYQFKSQKFIALENYGLPTAIVTLHEDMANKYYVTMEDVNRIYQEYENSKRAGLDYEIDGLVIEINAQDEYDRLGINSDNRPNGAVAYKFPSIKRETKLLDITWQLGNTGTITPVAELEPVKMGGVTVKRASLHNLQIFKDLDVRVNDTVLVSRRGDVIPQIERVVERDSQDVYFGMPVNCPECDNELKVDGKFLVCDNSKCSGVMIGTILKWLRTTGMASKGIGEKTIEKLFSLGLIQLPSDLYKIKESDISNLEGFGKRSAEKFVSIVQSHKEVPLAEFIGGLNMKNFSTSMAKLLVDSDFDTLDKMRNITVNELVKIKGIEIKTADGFLTGLYERKDVIDSLINVGVTIKENKVMETNLNGVLLGKSFCFTGKVEATDADGNRYKRGMLEALVIENGGTTKNVSNGLTYLVQADPSSQSSKTVKALKLGVEIISDVEFLEMLK